MKTEPGLIILFGSGEASPSGREVWEWLFAQMGTRPQVAIVETPAGFQPNSAQVARRIGDFLDHHLQNYEPHIDIVPARQLNTPFSPDNPDILTPMLTANVFFLGPGSPSYAARQLEGSLAWDILAVRHQMGAHVVLASSAVVAVGSFALPVYEIYKVGEALHWHTGLDFLIPYGLQPTFIPHWNNNEGGEELDTRYCFMGQARFDQLREMLPGTATIVGIDEHTALMMGLVEGQCWVRGRGQITILRGSNSEIYPAGSTFPLEKLGLCHIPAEYLDIRPEAWQMIQEAEQEEVAEAAVPPMVQKLVEERVRARGRKEWAIADQLRTQIEALGWAVKDTPHGPELERLTSLSW
ncbi:MAG: cysteinyl-tRNA synthetase [Chloroflexi bacterium]|nr:cysteinyl-tRNA synthetase [Chloroflexota bacterium]MBP8057455.1 cysteinyl-tRNA synthetase [Chloroflexota bacterium]